MVKIESIMSAKPVFVSQHANVHRARKLMADKQIRHLPVKDVESGKLIGMVNQKMLLANAIKIINQRGFEKLEHTEKSMDVGMIMNEEISMFSGDTGVVEVAKALKSQRSGCVAIVNGDDLIGIVTSSDFVTLAINQFSDDS